MPARLLLLLAALLALAPDARATGYALVVGIDGYRATGSDLGDLSYAEADATRIAEYFAAQNYDVRLLLGSNGDGGRADILAAVAAIASTIRPEDTFVFSFSGHGIVEEENGVELGYLVAQGPPGPASRLSAADIQDIMRSLDAARHQLFIFASCYGGLLGQLPRRSGDILYDSTTYLLADLQQRTARHYLSAGGGDQQVLDSGPAGLSWFTYFLLKGLEPQVVSRRPDGVLTFSELATFVQAWSANPYHTPAFGSLAGDGGGQFIFRTTDTGRPRLPALPDVSPQTLADLGFLARGQPNAVEANLLEMRSPIDQIYRSWEQLDLGLYMDQFDLGIVQTGRLRGGETSSRGYDGIRENRSSLFPRLDRVTVKNYELMFQGFTEGTATFGVVYSMDFVFRDGRVIEENNVKECYKVRRSPDGRWRIVRNDDYQQRICS